MPQVILMINADDPAKASHKALMQVARVIASEEEDQTITIELFLENVRERYTPISIEERDKGQFRVILYGSFRDIARYEHARKT